MTSTIERAHRTKSRRARDRHDSASSRQPKSRRERTDIQTRLDIDHIEQSRPVLAKVADMMPTLLETNPQRRDARATKRLNRASTIEPLRPESTRLCKHRLANPIQLPSACKHTHVQLEPNPFERDKHIQTNSLHKTSPCEGPPCSNVRRRPLP